MPRRIERRSDAKRMRPSRSGHDGLKTHDGTTADRPPFDRLKVNILCDGSLIRRPLPRLLTLALSHTVYLSISMKPGLLITVTPIDFAAVSDGKSAMPWKP